MAISEQEARQLVAEYQEYQRSVETLQGQMEMVRNTLAGCDSSINTITALKEAAAAGNSESVIPVGSGCFVHAEIRDFSKVIINIGSGANVEKNVDDALAFLKERRDKLEKMIQDLNESLAQILQNMREIESKLN
ncbi:Prefoldin subunit alpha [Methanimicrococcus sp. At1]|uniref:Prefoldin subunit alpha n=1 Tax=Methanimicrococcus hacksteinii TaxID=3028293 RepID=A0ABU3VMT9_9EURY|nr:prefoldin subunit alpha [Methanimicrococcus sp. At1]MDV0444717.1 Prefoldin subunit alpha [Methanimicrococcus sp. At1]